jgi:hypothetical protein
VSHEFPQTNLHTCICTTSEYENEDVGLEDNVHTLCETCRAGLMHGGAESLSRPVLRFIYTTHAVMGTGRSNQWNTLCRAHPPHGFLSVCLSVVAHPTVKLHFILKIQKFNFRVVPIISESILFVQITPPVVRPVVSYPRSPLETFF